jgi:hypothetical protein
MHARMSLPPSQQDPRLAAFAPAAERSLQVFGAPATLVLLPSRKLRRDRPSADRPAFRQSPVPRILGEEVLWRGEGLAMTPNRYPFAAQQRLLWPIEPRREPDLAMWTTIGAWVDGCDGTALLNNIGSAASIARAHAHLIPERLPFLDGLAERPAPADLLEVPPGVQIVAKDVPFCLLGVRGPAAQRALAIQRLADARLTAAWNVLCTNGTAWLYPRRQETPAPHFPYALGASEVWGRWCYGDEDAFAQATGAMLEQALLAAGSPAL